MDQNSYLSIDENRLLLTIFAYLEDNKCRPSSPSESNHSFIYSFNLEHSHKSKVVLPKNSPFSRLKLEITTMEGRWSKESIYTKKNENLLHDVKINESYEKTRTNQSNRTFSQITSNKTAWKFTQKSFTPCQRVVQYFFLSSFDSKFFLSILVSTTPSSSTTHPASSTTITSATTPASASAPSVSRAYWE